MFVNIFLVLFSVRHFSVFAVMVASDRNVVRHVAETSATRKPLNRVANIGIPSMV